MNLRAAGCTAMLAAGLLMTAPVTASPARTPLAAAADSGGPCDPTVPSAFGSPADNAELLLRVTILADRVSDQRARAVAANVAATYSKSACASSTPCGRSRRCATVRPPTRSSTRAGSTHRPLLT